MNSFFINSELKSIEKSLASASSYEEWREVALLHDLTSGANQWKENEQSKYFDAKTIQASLTKLSRLRRHKDFRRLLFTLNEGLHGNIGGIGNSALYQVARFGTKKLIVDYVNEVVTCLFVVAECDSRYIPHETKRDFFIRARHCFGRTALMMSGSGMMMYFHLGVAKALLAEDLLPDIISGSSGGSTVGSILATHDRKELEQFFKPSQLASEKAGKKPRAFESFRPQILSAEEIRAIVERLVPDITFLEALKKTGRHINISIAPAETHQNSRLLNATTTPHVLVREAIIASAAVPGIYPAVSLKARDDNGASIPYLPNKKWVDGAISDDLPAKRLARIYGVNHFIVSQTNPHIIPFIRDNQRHNSLFKICNTAATRTTREWLNACAEILRKPLAKQPIINQLTNTLLAIVNQDYLGDINIIPPYRFANPARILADLSEREIKQLIEDGERSTWPKIEMIRTQTAISRTLQAICKDLKID